MFKSDFVNLILKIISTWLLYLFIIYKLFEDLKQDAFLLVLFIIISMVLIISTAIRIVKIINFKNGQKAD
ncbi:hypothetical protein CHH64_12490 [Terribacillus saccharophilus]|uniref:Uncharacterized protein n=1 Tax=Terribacillus saccharophilus TaxID=361277 RepID=A0A268A9B8_9BACI|nr:hypothetical protein CHH64_12490 [Terribacillus saccharophilus]